MIEGPFIPYDDLIQSAHDAVIKNLVKVMRPGLLKDEWPSVVSVGDDLVFIRAVGEHGIDQAIALAKHLSVVKAKYWFHGTNCVIMSETDFLKLFS